MNELHEANRRHGHEDALYRETPVRIAARRAEGCAFVEMETAALTSLAH